MTTRRLPRGAHHDESYTDAERAWLAAIGMAIRMAIRLGRVRLGWSQAELAERSGTSRVTVSYAERGYQSSLLTYRRVADALRLPLVDVLREAEARVASPMPGDHVHGERRVEPVSTPDGLCEEEPGDLEEFCAAVDTTSAARRPNSWRLIKNGPS
jgi:transcriptional regulator with XRE-family HTH domain